MSVNEVAIVWRKKTLKSTYAIFYVFFLYSFVLYPWRSLTHKSVIVHFHLESLDFSDTNNHGLWKTFSGPFSSNLKSYMLSCCDQLIVCAQESSPDNYQLKKARICIFAASFIFGGAHLNWDKSFTLHCFFVLSSTLWSDPSRIVHPQRWHVPSQILSRCHNFPLKTWHLFN